MPTSMTDLIARVRGEIGDPPQPFRTTALGDGQTVWFDLPKQQVSGVTQAMIINGATITNLVDASTATAWLSTTAYLLGAFVTYNGTYYQCALANTNQVPPSSGNSTYWTNISATAYIIDDQLGQVQLAQAVPLNANLLFIGASWSMFSDTELTVYINDAINQHFHGREITDRHRDVFGHIDYRRTPMDITNIPPIEVPLVVMLATINTFWTLANDTASDFNVSTAEGTNIDRTSQYRQIMSQIGALTERYQELCGQLNVGIYRAETLQLRRVSLTTGRLVPIYAPREYDDHEWPEREIPPIDRHYTDNSGIASPIWQGNGY